MVRTLIISALVFINLSTEAQNAGINNNWLMGYQEWGGIPFGETKIDFYTGAPVISYYPIPMDFNHTHANISDSSGNLLFYTNGVYIADATHDTMMNGSGINPGAYSNFVPDGHLIAQGALIIKKPGWGNEYYVFHMSCDHYPQNGCRAYQLYLSIVDMDLNGSLGAVTLKNHPLIIDTLNTGKIHAIKHANGRDWWVVCHRVNSNMYYKILVTPYGLPTFSTQNIGSYRMWDAGQAKFSPDGTKYAYYHYFDGLDIMDFDRCTGMFSNVVSDTTLPYIQGNVGCEFSPNSQLLYVTNILSTYQYDVTVSNPIATRIEVAVWDTFMIPGLFLGVYMCIPQLAPDGKIYITTGNSTEYLGRINNPDIPGIGCDVAQHSVVLPTISFNTLPNHPNYFLGKIPGSPCDTVVDVGLGPLPPEGGVGVFPNPTSGVFTLSYPAKDKAGLLELYDVNGRQVHREEIAPWSQFKRVESAPLSKGIYFCRLRWGSVEGSIKVLVE